MQNKEREEGGKLSAAREARDRVREGGANCLEEEREGETRGRRSGIVQRLGQVHKGQGKNMDKN